MWYMVTGQDMVKQSQGWEAQNPPSSTEQRSVSKSLCAKVSVNICLIKLTVPPSHWLSVSDFKPCLFALRFPFSTTLSPLLPATRFLFPPKLWFVRLLTCTPLCCLHLMLWCVHSFLLVSEWPILLFVHSFTVTDLGLCIYLFTHAPLRPSIHSHSDLFTLTLIHSLTLWRVSLFGLFSLTLITSKGSGECENNHMSLNETSKHARRHEIELRHVAFFRHALFEVVWEPCNPSWHGFLIGSCRVKCV